MSGPITIVCAVTNDLNQDQRMRKVCTSLYEAGYQVTLVGRSKRTSADLLPQAYRQVRLEVTPESGPRFYYNFNSKLEALLQEQKPHIIYSADTDTLLACGRAKKQLRSKLILDAHEYFVEVPELQSRPLKKLLWRAVEKRYIPTADACITVSSSLAEVLGYRDGREYTVVRNVPLLGTTSQRPPRSEKKIMLYQGVLNKGRGLEQAIDSMALLDDPSLELHIVGGGDLEQELRTRAAATDYRDKIVFRGWLHGTALRQATGEAWLGLNLLAVGSLNYKYSLANKFFDYMHAHVPSVNMSLPEYQTILQRHKVGIMCEKLSAESLAHAVREVSDRKHRAMVAACTAAAEEYNWQQEQQVLLGLVARVAADQASL